MTRTASVREAKTHLSQLLAQVLEGEEVVILKSGKPVARLVPISPCPARRVPGSALGQITIADDFDAPLPEELLVSFKL